MFVAFFLRERDLHDYFIIHNEDGDAVARFGTIGRDLDGVAAVLDDVFHLRFFPSAALGLAFALDGRSLARVPYLFARVTLVFGPVLREMPSPAATVNTRHLEVPSVSAIWP